jgi:hypothetical protein
VPSHSDQVVRAGLTFNGKRSSLSAAQQKIAAAARCELGKESADSVMD